MELLTFTPAGPLVAEGVAEQYGMEGRHILGPSRERRVQKARIALYRALQGLGWSYARIGAFVGGRHWTTVRDAVKERKRAWRPWSNREKEKREEP
jgi:chromosomal replication initiation ATPase DnaA